MSTDAEAAPGSEDLFENAACGLLLTLANGTILRVNQTFCDWLGMEREALSGQRFQALLSMGGKIFHQTHWAPLLQMQGSVSEVKLDLLHADGRAIPMMLNAVRRETAQGVRHELAVFIAEDRNKYERELLASRKMAEELLLQQLAVQKELSLAQNRLRLAHAEAEIRATFAEQMVGIVSHDLRNPLTAVMMAAGLVGRDPLSERQSRALIHISQSAQRAERLIVDLLDFTQARVGRGITVSPKPLDLHQVMAACVEELRLTFPGRELIHRCEGEGDCTADADRLFQLTGNLVANAMAYGAVDGAVLVTSAFDAHWIKVSVHNTGTPLPPELVERLFEPMTRGSEHGGETRSVGLGLFIVREIARAHWGDVSVTSSEAEGTTFTVNLARPASA